MALTLPPQLAQALAAGMPSHLQGDGYDNDSSQDPLSVLQDCIQHLHFQVIPALTDPQDTNQAVQALKILTGIQQHLAQGAQNGPQQAG